jgi:chemotaxis protein histidine kinase CheA
VRDSIGLAAIAGLAVFAAFVGLERFNTESRRKNREQDVQLAQQNIDLATSQRSALDAQLKKAEEKAQQNADLATSQRSALETQLKKAEEKAQLAQQNANLTSQSGALEADLKKAQEEKTQLAQQNANLTSQSGALGDQLKKAEEKVQVAQQNTDLANNQRSALETELKKVREDKTQLAQQNADLAASQRSTLETELKKAQEEKAQLAQQNADLATSQGSALEEKQDGLSSGKYARLNPPQDLSPIPSPSTKEPETSNPPESQSDRSAEASGEEEFLKEFVLGYLRTVASNDTSMQRRYFAEQVNFYGRGVLNSSNIEASTQRYHDEWPIREWAPRGEAKVVRSRNPNLFVVYQPFSWTVSDGSTNAHGNATLYLRIRKNSQGEFRIVHVHQVDR